MNKVDDVSLSIIDEEVLWSSFPQSCGRNGVNYLSLFHYSMIQGSFFMRMHCGARHCLCSLVMYCEGNLGSTTISRYWDYKIIVFDYL